MATSRFDAQLRQAPRRPLALYTAECLRRPDLLKTTVGLLRFAPERVRAVLDERHAGAKLDEIPGWQGFPAVPVVADIGDLPAEVESLVVGLALAGRTPLLERHRSVLRAAADGGLLVFNGLHDRVGHPDVVELRQVDPEDLVLAERVDLRSRRILTVGTAPNIGKMTTAVTLQRELADRGVAADLLATGQTAMLLRGHGRAVDAIPGDFAPGVVEQLLVDLEAQAEVVVIEGQGSIHTPRYSAVTVAIAHATRPQHHVLCHRVAEADEARVAVEDSARRHARLFDALDVSSQLLGVALDTRTLTDGVSGRLCAEIEDALGVRVADPVRDGLASLADAFAGVTG